MFTFLLILQSLIAATMVGVILMQRSEGGGLGVGGSPSGLMSARGAADFLTRATAVLATLFVLLSIILAGLATVVRSPGTIDPSIARQRNAAPLAPSGPAALGGPAAPPTAQPAAPAPAPASSNGSVPLAQ
jgi:preprotein translocase subunit SecG